MIGAADFREIVRTLQTEYAGAEELKEPEAGRVFAAVIGMLEEMHLLEDDMFCGLIRVYLTVQGAHKVRFTAGGGHSCGFTARGIGESLYVESVGREDRVRPGDRILTMNGDSPADYRAKLSQRTAPLPISERDSWDAFLNYANQIEILHADGTKEALRLRKFPAEEQTPVRELRRLSDGALYARLDRVDDSEETADFLRQYREQAAEARTVVLDLRHQRGEGLTGYRAFVETVIPEPMSAAEFWGRKDLWTRYSETNTDRLIEGLQRMRTDADGELTAYLDEMLAELREERGRGFVPEPEEDPEEDDYIPGPRPERVILLLDTQTADDAEWFAARAARFDRVTTIGRETSGDYCYDYPVVLRFFRGVELSYPIAKSAAMRQAGECRGVKPMTEIPWTPEELLRDELPEQALRL